MSSLKLKLLMRLPRKRRRSGPYSPPPIPEDTASVPTSANFSAGRASGNLSALPDTISWAALTTALEKLHMGLNVFPPLQNAVNELVDCVAYPQIEQNRQEYNEIVSDLAKAANQLQKHVHKLKSTYVPYSITNVARSIEEQIQHIRRQQNRSKPQRLASATSDEDVLKCYRRVGSLFQQLQADISLGVWDIADALQMDSQLKNLAPAHDALYNAALPADAMKRTGCAANTRVELLLAFKAWSRDEETANVYWMNGMAGTGKTTISYSLCEQLDCDNQLGGSFFCCRNSPDCRDVNQIIPTIAYQLARYSSPYKSALCQVLSDEPDVAKKNIPVQFQKLIVCPLKRVNDAIPSDVVVVIDALDECTDANGTKQLLDLLLQHTADLPIKILFTSRPDPCIVRKVTQGANPCPTLHLHEIERSLVQADIMTYLQEALSSIRPDEYDIERIALRAGALFIFAATAVRYILPDEESVDSHERLQSVLDADRASGSKCYEELDMLYTTILLKALDKGSLEKQEVERRRIVLETIVCAKEPITPAALAELLDLDGEQQVHLAVQPLQSVIHMSPTTGLISILHVSFPEFLLNPERAGPFHCDGRQRDSCLAGRCFELMTKLLRFNICGLESSYLLDKDVPDLQARVDRAISLGLFYSCQYWASHLLSCPPSDPFISLLDQFLRRQLLLWMEVLNLKGRIDCGEGILSQVLGWFPIDHESNVPRQSVEDARNFVIAFATSPATLSTPHIYVSVLPFTPRESYVWRNHWPRTRGLIDINATRTERRMANRAYNRLCDMLAGVQSSYNTVHAIAFSPNGTHVVFGSSNYAICVWNMQNGVSLTAPLQGHTRAVFSLAFSPDGTRIASGSADRSLRVWDAQAGTLVTGSLHGHTAQITSVTFSPDGCRVLSGSLDGTIRLWELRTGSLVVEPFKGHTGSVHSVAFSPGGMFIVSGSSDRTVRTWSLAAANTSPIWTSDRHTNSVICVTFSPNGTHVASGSCDYTIMIWCSQDGVILHGPLVGHTGTISSVAFSPDGTRIVSGSWDRTVRVWDLQSNALLFAPFEGHTSPVMSVFFSATGEQVVSGSNDGSIRFWGMAANGGSETRVIDSPSAYTGWLLDSRGRHVLCVPPDLHDDFFRPNSSPFTDLGGFIPDENDVSLGVRWASCYDYRLDEWPVHTPTGASFLALGASD